MIMKRYEDELFSTIYWDPIEEKLDESLDPPEEIREIFEEYKEYIKSLDGEELAL